MSLKEEYEQFWSKKEIQDGGFSYGREYVISKIFCKTTRQIRVLDLGCGPGIISSFLEKQGYSVVGLDISNSALKITKKNGIKSLVNGRSEKLPFNSKKFDRILIGDLLEHLIDPESCLKEVRRILKEQGLVIITVPNLGFYRARFYSLLHGYVYNFENSQNPPWKWQHIRFYNLKILTSIWP